MTTSQFFVYRRPVAWVALITTLAWGAFAYTLMPQRQDPIIPVRSGVILTAYPGAKAEKVEQEVTRKVEKKVAENPDAEKVTSISRQGLSIVFVELHDRTKDAEATWQDIQDKLREIGDLPTVGGQPLVPRLDKDFGDTVAVMLTISSPQVTDFEVEQRARGIRDALQTFREKRPERLRDNRISGVLVHASTFSDEYISWVGETLLRRLAERGLVEDGHLVEAPGAACVDFRLRGGHPEDELKAEVVAWQKETLGQGLDQSDVWPGVLIKDLNNLADVLKSHPHEPSRTLNRYGYRQLKAFADRIRDRLKQSPHVGKVETLGQQDEAIYLYYSDRRLSAFGVRPMDIVQKLRDRNTKTPGGRVELLDQEIAVRPSGEFRSEREIGDVIIAQRGGLPLYLRDLVHIVRSYEDPPDMLNFRTVKYDPALPPTARMPGDEAIVGVESHGHAQERSGEHTSKGLQTTTALTLAVRQVKGTQIADFSRDIDGALAGLKGVLPDDLQIERTSNEPALVVEKIEQFNQNLLEAIAIVIVVAFLFMEWRSAVLVALSIPLTVAMTLGICHLLGIDVQQISIAALIIALGLLVDDPVVAGDAINRELAHGTPRDVAAWLGPQKLARAILYATLTNCVAFLPLLLIEGESGEFVYSLPIVVTASLVSSRVVSMTFMPLLGYYLLRGQKGFEAGLAEGGKGSTFARYYNGFSEWCLDHKWSSLAACTAVLIGCMSLLPRIPTAFFPKDQHTLFTVNLTMPEGTPIRATREETLRTIQAINTLSGEHVASYTTFVGAGGPRFWLSVVPEQRADNYAQILVHTSSKEATAEVVARLKRELPLRTPGRITVEQLETGPPIGVPVQLRITGMEGDTLRKLGERVKGLLREVPGADNIHDDWEPEVFQLALRIKADKANLIGVSNDDLASMIGMGLSGWSPTTMSEADREIPITLRLRDDERTKLGGLEGISALGMNSSTRVPLSQVAEFAPEMVSPRILRRNHERCLTVKSDTVPGVLASQVVEQLDRKLKEESRSWPPGYRYEFGGEQEEQSKGFRSVAIALVVSLVSIYLALVLQFNSVTKPLVVYAAVPFGLVGGLMGLIAFGAPFGFMAFLGVASLAGVIVSHIIVLFDYIEEMREHGEPLHRAVIDAALVRLRPVLVTVLATVGGLIPLAIEGGPLWQPMCYVQIVGLLAATLVTKVVVPVIYVIFVEDLKLIRWEPPTTVGAAIADH